MTTPIDVNAAKTPLTPTQALKNELSGLQWPREGSVVEASLINKVSRQAFFDMGRFGTGMVYGQEFLNAREIIRNLKVGDTRDQTVDGLSHFILRQQVFDVDADRIALGDDQFIFL